MQTYQLVLQQEDDGLEADKPDTKGPAAKKEENPLGKAASGETPFVKKTTAPDKAKLNAPALVVKPSLKAKADGEAATTKPNFERSKILAAKHHSPVKKKAPGLSELPTSDEPLKARDGIKAAKAVISPKLAAELAATKAAKYPSWQF